MTATTRVERDSMGALDVPASALWGAQTQRALQNFPATGLRMPRAFIRALGLIKHAAAAANAELGDLPLDLAAAIQAAALEVAAGRYDEHFPIDVFQTGSGTSSNMNANEVIAALAARALSRAGAPERSREHESEQQRRGADRDSCRRRAAAAREFAAGARTPARGLGPTSRRIRRRGQDRPHPFDGCDAGHAGAGTGRVAGANRRGRRAPDVGHAPLATGWRRAAPRSAPASTPGPQFGAAFARRLAAVTGARVSPQRQLFRGACRARTRRWNCRASSRSLA